MFFVPWRDFAHPSAGGILDSRLPFKRRADLQKTIIDRLFVLVKQNFNRAKTLVNRFEQRSVILFPTRAIPSRRALRSGDVP
jgi:hypothetical protein